MREQHGRLSSVLRVVVPYCFFATIWILASDQVALWLSGGSEQTLTLLQSIKGTLFVLTSGLIIYGLLAAELQRRETAERTHRQELRAYIQKIEKHSADLEASHEAIIRGWAMMLELRDLETSGHVTRTCQMMEFLARQYRFSEEQMRNIRWGALLHDIGKIGIPDAILLKPGPLTPEERQTMQRHAGYARDILDSVPYLVPARTIPFAHHERWDGSGYPSGLRGEEIPLEARLFAVVDVADAMTSDRPYRQALPVSEAYRHLKEEAGRLYDPQVVTLFITEDLLRKC